ncbi:hypothetical protein [Arthrobacter ginkgonis]|uniref:hypothetical protein n=1 Tax=Arthrobacter ginkgonis TaxID=1630594 RepID=UPI0031EF1D40
MSASTVEDLLALAGRHGLELETAIDPECGIDTPQDLDGLEALLELAVSDDTCAQLLNAWNLFADIARSVGATLDDRGPKASKCYDKVFYGNNLECITPAGEHYSPDFSASEQRLIAEILNRGRTILASRLQVDPETEHTPEQPHRNQ